MCDMILFRLGFISCSVKWKKDEGPYAKAVPLFLCV